ncbi:glycoside hydrolase family 2 TIM barrel-domain containing protein [Clostridium sp. D33t1_170424_F3]|uniref:glycoside hydrolase family 2 TIM barrel-domain containing protein n=1 Tax=Clostridium sp. D33t1_170424_F3 TaxID=2787099 RepID=UPI0018A9B2B2|nr:glycoside hydrolase family 2 TIM barrel-domain containing protein [Clostridium sp. D33t1_170424_F3]
MKRKKALAVLLALVMALTGTGLTQALADTGSARTPADPAFDGEYWYNATKPVEGDSRFSVTKVYEENREPQRSYFIPYDTEEKALARDREASDYYMLLNGDDWKFKLVDKPADAIMDFQNDDYDTESWDNITVPRSWQMEGYDVPIYTNIKYPWTNYEPRGDWQTALAPTVYNPVGHYKKTFTLPESWDGREVFASFQGVESCIYLYINGQYVGYSEDSFTMHDFNITPYLKAGENTMALRVYRWCDGTWLEDADYIRLSGIFRDVELYSKDKVEMRDYFVRTTFTDDTYTDMNLSMEVDVRTHDGVSAEGYSVRAKLLDADGKVVFDDVSLPVDAIPAGEDEVKISKNLVIDNPHKWSAEDPYLYNLLLQLVDADGNVVENIGQRVGFRQIELKKIGVYNGKDYGNKQMITINGERIMLRGFNRHEVHPEYGRYLPRDFLEEDIKLMKQSNVNAIRTSHYPNDPNFYDLCDEYGIYICDEANDESHDVRGNFPSNIEEWRAPTLDRMINMVERDKNFPSVVIWSLGNEASEEWTPANGNAFKLMSEWTKERDDGRPIKYERDNRWTDIMSVQYPAYSSVTSYCNGSNIKPYIMSEYAHAMGNSTGYYKKYWDIFRVEPQAQGGFMWDWADQTPVWDLPTSTESTGLLDEASNLRNSYTGTLERVSTTPIVNNVLRGGAIFDSTPYLNFYTGNTDMADGVVVGKTFTIDVTLTPEKPAGYDNASDRVFNYIVGKGDQQYALQHIKTKTGEELVQFYFGKNWEEVNAPAPADWFGREHRVTVSYNYDESAAKPTSINIYIDGALQGSYSGSTAMDQSSQKFSIGVNSQYPDRGVFNGAIDSVRIFKEALTPAAIDEADMEPGDQYRVFFWADFDDEEGVTPTQVVDKGGYGYNGTLRSGSTIAPKDAANAVSVPDGTESKPGATSGDKALRGSMTLESADDLDITGTTPLTLEAWVKPEALSGHKTIMGKGDNQFALKTNGKKLEFFIYDETKKNSNYDQYVSVAADLTDEGWINKWQHVAGVYDGASLRLYLNGEQVAETVLDGQTIVPGSSHPFSIGACTQESGRAFTGLIDDVRVYDKALTLDEFNSASRKPSDANTRLWIGFEQMRAGDPIEATGPVAAPGKYYAYGGDWGETVHDDNFLANGVVSVDRIPHPALAQVKQVQQEINFKDTDVENGVVRIVNEFLFTTTEDYDFHWTLMQDEKEIAKGDFNVVVNPLSEQDYTIENFPAVTDPAPGAEYWLNFSATLKNKTTWADAGFEVAKQQFKLDIDAPRHANKSLASLPDLTYTEDGDTVTITGGDFNAVFDKTQGTLTSYQFQGDEYLVDGPAPNYFKAPVDNDRENGFVSRTATWKNAGKNRTVTGVQVAPVAETKGVSFTVNATLPTSTQSTYQAVITVYGNGEVVFDQTLHPGSSSLSEIPEVGTLMKIKGDYDQITYYGRGPEENYRDRQDAYDIGVYESTVMDQFVHYVEPQEHGNRSDVRWIALTNEAGKGFMVSAADGEVLETNASYFEQNDLASKKHPYQLVQEDDIYLKINQLTSGLGGQQSWGAKAEEYVTIRPNKDYNYSFRFSPIAEKNVGDMMQNSKSGITDKLVESISVDGTPIAGFDQNQKNYDVMITDTTRIPQVDVVVSDTESKAEITQAYSLPGTATIKVIPANADEADAWVYTIHFTVAQFTYMSDLDWTSATTGWDGYQPSKDSHAGEGKLTLMGENGEEVQYDKGIGTHATSDIVYHLDGAFDLFEGFVGVDRSQSHNNNASINFQIFLDGSNTPAFESGVMKVGAVQKKFSVDISGVDEIRLHADMVESNGNDHADWADLKLFKNEETGTIYAISKHVEGGEATVTTDKAAATAGETVTVAVSDIEEGKQFKSLSVSMALSGNLIVIQTVKAGEVYTFTMPSEPVNVTVVLEPKGTEPLKAHVLNVQYGGNAALEITGEAEVILDGNGIYGAKVMAGEELTLTFTPANGPFASAQLNGEDIPFEADGCTYTFTMPNENTVLRFTFTTVNKDVLETLLEKANEVTDEQLDKLVESVRTKFLAARDNAQKVFESDKATQDEVNEAWKELLDAMHYLSFEEGTKDELKYWLDYAAQLDLDNFTPKSQEGYAEALAYAQEVYNDEGETLKAVVEKATKDLYDAILRLTFKANTETLESFVEQAQEIATRIDQYLDGAEKDKFNEILPQAEALLENADATQKQVDELAEALYKAIQNMRMIPDREALKDLIDTYEALNPADYTEASYAILRAALNNALDVYHNDAATPAEIAAVYTTAEQAYDGLVPADKPETPVKPDNKPSNKPSNSGSKKPAGNVSGEGTAVVTANPVISAAQNVMGRKSVRSDTTMNFTLKRGSAYCFKMTVVNGSSAAPSFTVGNGNVLKTQFVAKIGNDYYYRVWAVGAPGQSTGVYTAMAGEKAQQHCVITIA